MTKRSFLKKLPFMIGAGFVGVPSIIKGQSLPIGYISPKAIAIRKEINSVAYPYATPKQSKQLIDELLDNSNPTAEQFEKIFDRCVISAETLYRLSADGFKMKK